MEKRLMGYVTDALMVFERIDGPTLAEIDLEGLSPEDRQNLFRRSGRLLREMERDGLFHWAAKPWNFIIRWDDRLGPEPMLIDVDGIHGFQYTRFALHRLLRGMKEQPQYTPADSFELCMGYAPFAQIGREERSPDAPSSPEAGSEQKDEQKPDGAGEP